MTYKQSEIADTYTVAIDVIITDDKIIVTSPDRPKLTHADVFGRSESVSTIWRYVQSYVADIDHEQIIDVLAGRQRRLDDLTICGGLTGLGVDSDCALHARAYLRVDEPVGR